MRGVYGEQEHPAASQNRRFALSPTDALIDLKVGGRLRCPIPVGCPIRPGRNTLTDMRIAVIPQRWSTRRGYVGWLRVNPDVIQNPPDLNALGNERVYPMVSRKIAARCQLSQSTVTRDIATIKRLARLLKNRAIERLTPIFMQSGLVGDAVEA